MEEKREKVNKEENVVEPNNGEKKDEARKKVDKAVNDYVKDVKDFIKDYTEKEKSEGMFFGILSYISVLCLIPYLLEDKNNFVKFHAKQGLNLFLLEVIVGVSASILVFLLLFLGFAIVLVRNIIECIFLVVSIMGIIDVATGKARELPIVNKIISFNMSSDMYT